MKKNILAIAIVAATSAGTAQAGYELFNDGEQTVSLGGRIQPMTIHENGNSYDMHRARLDLKINRTISETMTGFARWESQWRQNTGQSNIKVYAGVKSGDHAIQWGRTGGSQGLVTNMTDITSWFGGAATNKLNVGNEMDGVIHYTGSFGSLEIQADVATAKTDTETRKNGNIWSDTLVKDTVNATTTTSGYSVGAKYKTDMGVAFGLTAGQEEYEKTLANQETEDTKATNYVAAVSYSAGPAYVAASYVTGTRAEKDRSGFELASSYKTGDFKFYGLYQDRKDENAQGKKEQAVKAYVAGARYYFAPSLWADVIYNFDKIEGNKDQVFLDLRYNF
ncbi:porin [Endozoicomonas sp. OPT23]|uniref:porin n=1 Tax=Endozoicomonas sp. OPT23 TaxID=2072845 RepID=UPI00129A1E5C|nr:porin [Endozoicomonas sp. OPT23]